MSRKSAVASKLAKPINRHYYGALEGWRGVCACLVALYHFRGPLGHHVSSHVLEPPLIQHAYMFVDFFFVLSGFVIAASYRDRITERRVTIREFLTLRLARIYPMHLFTMLLMLALIVTFQVVISGFRVGVPVVDMRPETWVLNLLLLQGLHTTPGATLNHPSWSISTELTTYVVFALIWRSFARRAWIVSAAVIATAPVAILMLAGNIDTTYTWGILRSLLGFALGAVLFDLLQMPRVQSAANAFSRDAANLVEVIVFFLVVNFVSLPDRTPVTIAAPFLFAITIAVFAFDRGCISTILNLRAVRHIGVISYSIYMLHWPLQMAFIFCARRLSVALGWNSLFPPAASGSLPPFGGTPLTGDVATMVMLALLIGGATWTYRYVELPWRMRARKRS